MEENKEIMQNKNNSSELNNEQQVEVENNEISNNNAEKSSIPQNKNSFFNKSMNATNLAGRAANGLGDSMQQAGDFDDKMVDPNETKNALGGMAKNAGNKLSNVSNMAKGLNNKKNNLKNKNENKNDTSKKEEQKSDSSENKNDDTSNTNNKIKDKAKNIGDKAKKKVETVKKLKKVVKIFMALPLTVKIILVVLLMTFFIVILFFLLFMIFSNSAAFAGTCISKDFDISDISDRSIFTYTAIFDWEWVSPVLDFYQENESHIDEDGFLRIGDDYAVALGKYFGTKKGTRYLITFESGKTITAILADTKKTKDSDTTERLGTNGDLIEFERGCGTAGYKYLLKHNIKFDKSGGEPVACNSKYNEQNKIYSVFNENVKSIQLLSNTCNFSGQFMFPAGEQSITSCFGYRNIGGGASTYHEGIDIAYGGCEGSDVYAAASGEIVDVMNSPYNTYPSCSNACGNGVEIKHDNKYTTLYCHLKSINVTKGDSVNQGDVIGVLGNTGCSTGAHLHFAIYKNNTAVNPNQFFNLKGCD